MSPSRVAGRLPAAARPHAPDRRGTRALRSLRRPAGRPQPHETVWLFDLDNTLHDCSRHIFQAIDGAMSDAMMRWLNLDRARADTLRLEYWRRYGATAIGLERHHGIAATDFLEACHDFDVTHMVHAERGLAHKLGRLPGRKILLTNAPLSYARRVLHVLGILQEFEGLWSIDHMRLQGRLKTKPSVAMMRQLLAQLHVPARQVVLVDDTLANLRSARQVGMRTVLSHHPGTPHNARHHGRSPYVDIRVKSVGELTTRAVSHRKPGIPGHGHNAQSAIACSGRLRTAGGPPGARPCPPAA